MTADRIASWAYTEEFIPETPLAESARAEGERAGAMPIGGGTAAMLRVLAAATGAKSAVEVGTGAGVSGLALLEGMAASDGILTTIDVQPANQRVAKQAFLAAGIPHQRTRVIAGRALDVLPRLTDGAYDLVFVDADKTEYPQYVEQALRLLRSGGILLIDNMLWHDTVADPAARDPKTAILRQLGKDLRDRDDLIVALLPVGDGLLTAVKR